MSNILIQADRDKTRHKMKGEVPDGHKPYWTVNGTPRSVEPGEMIKFSDGEEVYAKGVIIEVEEGRIWFDPLVECSEDNPVSPPDRGFKYITEQKKEEFRDGS